MKKIRFFNESIDFNNKEEIYNYKDISIEPYFSHTNIRFSERNILTLDNWKIFFKRMIDKFIDLKLNKYEYLVFSKSMKQGIIVQYLPKDKTIILRTILKNGKQDLGKYPTKKIIIEKYDDTVTETCSNEFIDYLGILFSDKGLTINEDDKDCCYIPRTLTYDHFKINVILCENKFWDLNCCLIEID